IDLRTGKGRAHRNKRQLRFQHRLAKVGGRPQLASDVLAKQRLETALKDGRYTLADAVHFALVGVDANDVVPFLSEAYTTHQAYISCANDRNLHHASSAIRLPAYQRRERLSPSSIWIAGLYP